MCPVARTALALCALLLACASRADAPRAAEHAGVDPALLLGVLTATNTRFNAFTQLSDESLWGRRDYWATPAESIARAAGDCEDLAIAKYFALIERGIPESQLRLVVARLWVAERRLIEGHMVLAFLPAPGAEPWILDNVTARILPLSQRPDLVALVAFNRDGWWSLGGGVASYRGPTVPFPAWHDMLARMQRTEHVRATVPPVHMAPAATAP